MGTYSSRLCLYSHKLSDSAEVPLCIVNCDNLLVLCSVNILIDALLLVECIKIIEL